jgi:hypothetical protein
MVLLSFMVKEQELKTRSKTHTVRPYSPNRFKQLWNAQVYQIWWKSRTKAGYKLYDAIQDGKPYLLKFTATAGMYCMHFYCTMIETRPECGCALKSGRPVTLSCNDFRILAERDGFSSPSEMMLHFIHVYGEDAFKKPFIGVPFLEGTGPVLLEGILQTNLSSEKGTDNYEN